MKFLKHFADFHSSMECAQIIRKLGMEGVGQYWILVELCCEKLEKARDEEFTETHCVFHFDCGSLANTLHTKSKRLAIILQTFCDRNLIAVECSGDIVTIKMPKLLDFMDRDSNRARPARGSIRPKTKIKERDQDSYNKSPLPSKHMGSSQAVDIQAQKVLNAIDRFGPTERDNIRASVGEDLFELVQLAGGWQLFRDMKRDNWTAHNVAKKLAAAEHLYRRKADG